jgi:hypothetical protein
MRRCRGATGPEGRPDAAELLGLPAFVGSYNGPLVDANDLLVAAPAAREGLRCLVPAR